MGELRCAPKHSGVASLMYVEVHLKVNYTLIKYELVVKYYQFVIVYVYLTELGDNKRVKCLAIATLRNTFVLWDKETGACYHNFIVWNDLRAFNGCTKWNKSLFIKVLNSVSKLLYFVSRSKRFLVTSMFKFSTAMVALKLVWVLNNVQLVKERALEGKVLYGTLDTWLLWKLTGGEVHATEPTNACGSGFYDTIQLKWCNCLLKILDIPSNILPKLKNTNDFFGTTQPHHFGYSIPIHALVGDQSAATFGECCFNVGDVKITIGTGSFVNINTGCKPKAVLNGIYPMVGWKLKNEEAVFILEGGSHDSGAVINWAQSIDLFKKPDQTQSLAESVADSNGLYFVPAFSGLQAPYNDPSAVCSIIGINATTNKAHITRAILEALAFRILEVIEVISKIVKLELKTFR
jgi:putative glycerol kinase 5